MAVIELIDRDIQAKKVDLKTKSETTDKKKPESKSQDLKKKSNK